MTLMIATVMRQAAWLSQDTAMFAPIAGMDENAPAVGLSADHASAADGTFIGDGKAPEVSHLGDTCKIIFAPHHRMISGVAGMEVARIHWEIALQRHGPRGDVSELPQWAPAALSEIRAACAGADLMVTCVGWSAQLGYATGFAFNSADDFKPVELVDGHSMVPVANPSCARHAEIVSRWTWAARGIEVESFHRMVAENQVDSFRRGLLAPGRGLGGQLITARVDQVGISISPPHFLSDFVRELVAARLADAGYDLPPRDQKPV